MGGSSVVDAGGVGDRSIGGKFVGSARVAEGSMTTVDDGIGVAVISGVTVTT